MTAVGPKGMLGILAGLGALPWQAARNALAAGEEVKVFYFTGESPPVDLEHLCEKVVLTRIYTSVIKSMRKSGVDRLILLGKATRDILYKNPRFDIRTALLLARMLSQSDYTLFAELSTEFAKQGIEILPQDIYLNELHLRPGRYGKKLSKAEVADVIFGLDYAREINRLDIGQTVVVGNKSVLAVEAAEGTDRCIQRGGKLFRGKGAVVCKLPKVDHDMRFDIPATGETTLESMAKEKCRVLAIDGKRTFVVDPAAFLSQARQAGISILAIDEQAGANENYIKKMNASAAKLSAG